MKTRTQESQILRHLQEGRPITSLDALRLFGCLRLSARIYCLKKDGHNIATKTVCRNGKYVAQYRLA